MPQTRAEIETIWQWLAEIPDPEIPVISIVDLGIIRDVQWAEEKLEVTVTPTYSGCPATSLINFEIEKALADHGISQISIKRQLSPAWTTDWLSSTARQALKEYGIAPPIDGTANCTMNEAREMSVPCPRCSSNNTENISQFGSTPCKASWRCKDCLEPFDYFKCH